MTTIRREMATGSTSDATPLTIFTRNVPDNVVGHMRMTCIGVHDTGQERCYYEQSFAYQRNGGAVTTDGTLSVAAIETTAGLNAGLGGSGGNDVILQVTGLAGTNMNWRAVVEWFEESE